MPDRRRLLFDSDAFRLLAGAGVLDLAAELLGGDRESIRRLDPLPHMLRKQRERSDVAARRAVDSALALCELTTPIQFEEGDSNLLTRLMTVSKIDAGEALLIAIAISDPSSLLVSGDKKAIIALSRSAELRDVCDALDGRIVCMETIWRMLVASLGVDEFCSCCDDVAQSHQTLTIVIGGQDLRSEDKVVAGFESYERHLRDSADSLRLFEPG